MASRAGGSFTRVEQKATDFRIFNGGLCLEKTLCPPSRNEHLIYQGRLKKRFRKKVGLRLAHAMPQTSVILDAPSNRY